MARSKNRLQCGRGRSAAESEREKITGTMAVAGFNVAAADQPRKVDRRDGVGGLLCAASMWPRPISSPPGKRSELPEGGFRRRNHTLQCGRGRSAAERPIPSHRATSLAGRFASMWPRPIGPRRGDNSWSYWLDSAICGFNVGRGRSAARGSNTGRLTTEPNRAYGFNVAAAARPRRVHLWRRILPLRAASMWRRGRSAQKQPLHFHSCSPR